MGVDIYLKSVGAEFSCRLYRISDLFDQCGQYSDPVPELEKLAYYDSAYFKKIEGVNASLKNLIRLIKAKSIDKSIAVKLAGLIKRLENFTDNYSGNPDQEKAEIKIASGRGSVRID